MASQGDRAHSVQQQGRDRSWRSHSECLRYSLSDGAAAPRFSFGRSLYVGAKGQNAGLVKTLAETIKPVDSTRDEPAPKKGSGPLARERVYKSLLPTGGCSRVFLARNASFY